MTPERVTELAMEAWRKFSAGYAWNTQDCTIHIEQAILQAVAQATNDERERIMVQLRDHTPKPYTTAGIIERTALIGAVRSGEAAERG